MIWGPALTVSAVEGGTVLDCCGFRDLRRRYRVWDRFRLLAEALSCGKLDCWPKFSVLVSWIVRIVSDLGTRTDGLSGRVWDRVRLLWI